MRSHVSCWATRKKQATTQRSKQTSKQESRKIKLASTRNTQHPARDGRRRNNRTTTTDRTDQSTMEERTEATGDQPRPLPMGSKGAYSCRLLTIGDSSVGKTSIVLRFDQQIFSTKFVTTIGVDYRDKMVKVRRSTVSFVGQDDDGGLGRRTREGVMML